MNLANRLQKQRDLQISSPTTREKGHPQKHGGIAYECPERIKKQSLRLGRVV